MFDGSRASTIAAFLRRAGWADATIAPLAGDASFRRYFRLARGGSTTVLMDAPPPEDVRPFVAIGRHLVALGLSAPIIVAEEPGLLLLEDLGDATFTRELAAGSDEGGLYALATDVLIALHRHPHATAIALGPYDDAELINESLLFTDWYLPEILGRMAAAPLRDDWIALWRAVLPRAHGLPDSLVLRDYHVDNLMQLPDRHGVAACGLLDFQDGLIGSVAYDLVSLIEDARRDVSDAVAAACVARYRAAFPALDPAALDTALAVLGAQRSARIIGIFTRLMRRDGKPQYLKLIPRVWRLLARDLAHPALAPVRAWLDRVLPQAARGVPAARVPA